MNIMLQPHSIGTLFRMGIKIYQAHFIPLIVITAIFLLLPWVVGVMSLYELESVLFFLVIRLLEAAVTLGLIGLMFRPIFPAASILRAFRSSIALGTIHIAILQYLIFVFGVIGLMLPFPLNILLVAVWISSIFFLALAQPVFMVEGLRGVQALIRSFYITRTHLARTFLIIILTTSIQFLVFGILFRLFLPELNLSTPENAEEVTLQLLQLFQHPDVHEATRWAQYLSALLITPFASVILALLYFNLTSMQSAIDNARLQQIATTLLGISSDATESQDTSTNSSVSTPQSSEFSNSSESETLAETSTNSEAENSKPLADDKDKENNL